MVLSSQEAVFGEDPSAAWQWLLPNLTPTLGLVGAAAYARRNVQDVDTAAVKPLFFMALAVSLAYLLLLTMSVVGVMFTTDPVAWLSKSNLWLGPVQGLAASALGVFFTK